MSAYEHIAVTREGPLTIVTIRRPERMNALHAPAHFELAAAFDHFAADPDQQVAILTGAGDRAFCAGNDLRHQAEGGDMSKPASGFGGLAARFDLTKPVIAAVNGVAMGGGFELALACDIIVAADHARFALPEPSVGLLAAAGGVHRLPRAIGLPRAMGIILTGRHVPAAEGERLGFVTEVTAADALLDRSREWAALILRNSPAAVRAAKEAALRGLAEESVAAALDAQESYPAVAALRASPDAKEGAAAFAAKRPPVWAKG